MKKQTWIWMLALSAALVLGGCAGSEQPLQSSDSAAEQTQESVSETESAEETEAGENETQTEDETAVSQIELEVSSEYLSEWEDSRRLMFAQCNQLNVIQSGYEALDQALNLHGQERWEQISSLYEEGLSQAREYADESGTEDFQVLNLITVTRSDSRIVSFLEQEYDFMPGTAHPGSSLTGLNYNPDTGETLTLREVAADYDGLYRLVGELLKENYDVEETFFPDYEETLADLFETEGNEPAWTMTREDVSFYFGPYVLGPYSSGTQTVTVSFAEHPGLFDARYAGAEGGIVRELTMGMNGEADVDGDGTLEKVWFEQVYDDEKYEFQFTLHCGDQQVSQAIYGSFSEARLMFPEDGNVWVYVETYSENDYRTLEIFGFDGTQPVYVGASSDSFYDHPALVPSGFRLYQRLYVLGTYMGSRVYHVGADGMPEAEDDVYLITDYGLREKGQSIRTKREIPAMFFGEGDTQTPSVSGTIPAGTDCYIRKTDQKSFVEVELEDGSRCRIPVEAESDRPWNWSIDGVSEYDCFEELLYAG